MKTEEIILAIKDVGKPVWEAAEKAAIWKGVGEVVFAVIAALVAWFFWKRVNWNADKEVEEIIYFSVCITFAALALLFLAIGFYDLLTYKYQAFMMIRGG